MGGLADVERINPQHQGLIRGTGLLLTSSLCPEKTTDLHAFSAAHKFKRVLVSSRKNK
jgi:hypothetical protein